MHRYIIKTYTYVYVCVKLKKVYKKYMCRCVPTKMEDKMEHKIYGEIRVAQYTKEGHLIRIWESQIEASERTGVPQANISACCHGKLKTAGGFRWSFR